MAQNFRRYMLQEVGTVAADIPDGSNFDSYDTIVGIHMANITTQAITVDAYIQHTINNVVTNFYLIKGAPLARSPPWRAPLVGRGSPRRGGAGRPAACPGTSAA